MNKTKNDIKVKATRVVHLLMANGGKGSGNWGHEGRPGLVGGSAKSSGGGSSKGSRKSSGKSSGKRSSKGSSKSSDRKFNSTGEFVDFLFEAKEPMTDSDMAKRFGKKHTFDEFEVEERWNVNPDNGKKSGYSRNCQLVVPALEASMRGYKVKAKPRTKRTEDVNKDSENISWFLSKAFNEPKMFCQEFWDGADGKPAKNAKGEANYHAPHMNVVNGEVNWVYPHWTKAEKDALQKHIESYPESARMQVAFKYTDRKGGHTTMLQRVPRSIDPNGWVILEGQRAEPEAIPSEEYFDNKGSITIMRIDNKPFNGAFIDAVMERRDEK